MLAENIENHPRKYVYTRFDEQELDVFCDILDVEKKGMINIADLEHAAKNLGLESNYQDIRRLLKPINQKSQGDIPVATLKTFLKSNVKTFEEEMQEIFENFDYDQKKTLSKHKLKVLSTELLNEEISDKEADEMIKLFTQSGSGLLTLEEFIKIQKMEVDV